jgi:hypothetical protein
VADEPTMAIGRRQVLTMMGAGALLAACGGGKSAAPASSSSPSAPNPGTTASTAATAPVTPGSIDGPVVADADRIPVDSLKSWASRFASSSWKGAWKDDSGGTGTTDGRVSVDPTAFRGSAELSTSDGLLGAGSKMPPATYDLDLTRVNYNADSYQATSPQLGDVEITVEGFGSVKLVCTKVPGHPDIDRVEIDAQAGQNGGAASVTYKIVRGTTVTNGAMAVSNGPDRPAAPEPGSANQQADFIQGVYAASLLSTADVSSALGVNAHPVEGNGGKANYQAGIDVSNARATTDNPDMILQYSIYRGTDATRARAFLDLNKAIATPIPGLGDAAYLIKAPPFIQVLQGNEVANITVIAPAGQDVIALDKAIAALLVKKLGRSS